MKMKCMITNTPCNLDIIKTQIYTVQFVVDSAEFVQSKQGAWSVDLQIGQLSWSDLYDHDIIGDHDVKWISGALSVAIM